MRSFSHAGRWFPILALWANLLLWPACAISLDHPDAATMPDGGLAVVSGCPIFQAQNPGVALLQGAGRSLLLADGTTRWSFSGASLTDGQSLSNGVLAEVAGDDASRCFPSTSLGTAPSFAPSPLAPSDLLTPLDMVEVAGSVWSYYQLFRLDSTATFGVVSAGFGVAPWDAATGQFVPTANLLWAGDGPSFGTSALAVGGDLYVYGCATLAGNTSPACYVAHCPAASLDDPTTYEYALGAGFYSSSVGDAQPILDGMGDVSIRQHPSGRILATYIAPLDTTLIVRSALSPTGPFSQPFDLALCDVGPGDFCVGAERHPELETDVNTIVLTEVAATFNSTPSSGDRYWPRLAVLPLPAALP